MARARGSWSAQRVCEPDASLCRPCELTVTIEEARRGLETILRTVHFVEKEKCFAGGEEGARNGSALVRLLATEQ